MDKKTEFTANLALDARPINNGWKVGANFAKSRKTPQKVGIVEFLKKRGIISFSDSQRKL